MFVFFIGNSLIPKDSFSQCVCSVERSDIIACNGPAIIKNVRTHVIENMFHCGHAYEVEPHFHLGTEVPHLKKKFPHNFTLL